MGRRSLDQRQFSAVDLWRGSFQQTHLDMARKAIVWGGDVLIAITRRLWHGDVDVATPFQAGALALDPISGLPPRYHFIGMPR